MQEANNYWALDAKAKSIISELLDISPKAKILLLIEDEASSIISKSPNMSMTDIIGVIQVSAIRVAAIEAVNFKTRQAMATELEENRKAKVAADIQEGNIN